MFQPYELFYMINHLIYICMIKVFKDSSKIDEKLLLAFAFMKFFYGNKESRFNLNR